MYCRSLRCGELEERVEQLDWERERAVLSHQEAERRCVALKSELKMTAESLTKAHLCIQGFVKENLRLAQQLETGRNAPETNFVTVGTETESVTASNDHLPKNTAATVLIRSGVHRALAKFRPALAVYRGRYERVCGNLAACRQNCELLRQRMEELGDFLQQLLDSWDANETLNLSSLRQGDNSSQFFFLL